MLQPGDCSPSRSVVSKMMTRFGSCGSTWRAHSPGSRSTRPCSSQGMRRAQRAADLLDRVLEVLVEKLLVLLLAASCSRGSTGARTCPIWISLRIFFISALVARVTTRGPRVRSPYLAVSRDELVHLGEAALVQQVDDQLQLVQALVVRGLRLVAGLDQRLEALDHQLGGTAAEHDLLAEEVGLGLLLEGRLEHAAARAADAVRVGEGLRLARCRSRSAPPRSGTARRGPAGTGGAPGHRGPSARSARRRGPCAA